MKRIIDSPFAAGKARLHKEEATATYRKEVFSYVRYFYICETTGMEFSNTETDEAGIQQRMRWLDGITNSTDIEA